MLLSTGLFAVLMPVLVLGILFVIFLRIMDHLKLRATLAQQEAAGLDVDGLSQRLDEIERRLTDVQDVMLALSEKFDRWESASFQAGPRP